MGRHCEQFPVAVPHPASWSYHMAIIYAQRCDVFCVVVLGYLVNRIAMMHLRIFRWVGSSCDCNSDRHMNVNDMAKTTNTSHMRTQYYRWTTDNSHVGKCHHIVELSIIYIINVIIWKLNWQTHIKNVDVPRHRLISFHCEMMTNVNVCCMHY